jgi:hypothetical protein
MMMTTLSHDGIARQSTVRQSINTKICGMMSAEHTCEWCGGVRPGKQVLYQYGTQSDASGNIDWHKGLFCSKGCHDAYHS